MRRLLGQAAPAAKAQIKADHEAMTRLSTHGAFIPVPDSAHAISLQKPQVVIHAIDKVVGEARASVANAKGAAVLPTGPRPSAD